MLARGANTQTLFANLVQVRHFAKRAYRNPRNEKIGLNQYPCVPEWQKAVPRDPFDYPLRSKQEVLDDFKYDPPNFSIQGNFKKYMAGDIRENDEKNLDTRDRVAKISLDMRELMFAPLQRERFVFLLGPRYDPKRPHFVKIVCKQYNTWAENYMKANETLRELYWEAKRAPETDVISKRNPYRRENLKKKIFGKTKEERQAYIKQLKQGAKEHYERVDREEMEAQLALDKETKSLRAKRMGYAQKRAALGFKDKLDEHEGVEDPILDKLEVDEAKYQKQLRESRERKPVKIATEVQGISKQEFYNEMLKEDEKFKEV